MIAGKISKFNSLFTGFTVLTIAAWPVKAGSIWAGLYDDFDIRQVSDNHLIIEYHPLYSDDFHSLGHADLINLNGKRVWGRVLLVAIPPDGSVEFTYNFDQSGSARPIAAGKFITQETALVQRGSVFEARDHKILRLYIFPQRIENGLLQAYSNFVIDLRFSSQVQPSGAEQWSRLDTVLARSVVNSEQFFKWGTKGRKRPLLKPAASTLFDLSSEWVKIGINQSGVTRLMGSALQQAGISLTGLQSGYIKMFYAGGTNPPEDPADPLLELYQIAIRVDDGGDGNFELSDALYFYAEAANRYEYDTGTPQYLANSYSALNYYWLAIGGYGGVTPLRWQSYDGTPASTPDAFITATRQMVRLEQDKTIDNDGYTWNYYDWYWSNQPVITASVNLPGLVSGDSVNAALEAIGSYSSTDLTLNGVLMNRYYSYGNKYWDNSGAGVPGLNTLQIALKPGGSGTYLDYIDISYARQLYYENSQLEFNSYSYDGILEFQVNGYNSSLTALDITESDLPAVVSGVDLNSGTGKFQKQVASGEIARFVIYAAGDSRSPVSLERISLAGLSSDLDQYDCLVISPRAFQTALQEYVDYRQANDGQRVKLVAVEDIYDEFGFGLESPIAIRDYLRFAYENYDPPAPYAVLLAGDGHYDYLNHMGRQTVSYIPPYIWSRQYAVSDDNYGYFGQIIWLDSDSSYIHVPDRGWDMMIARWPVRSGSEIGDYLTKLKNYESDANLGIWRSRITFVADDEFKGSSSTEIIHTAMAETLAVFHTPAEFIKNKIYLTDYPFAANGEKPAVNDAIVRAVNEGTLILNYIGHGSPDVWADEHVLKKSTDLNRMQNSDRAAVVVAASCSIGFFDAPDNEGMAEIMFRQDGGAISTVSAMRLVYAGDNSIFNYDLYDAIFAGQYNICEAVYTTKMRHQYSQDNSLIRNDLAYVFFGDPLARLGLPEYRLRIEPVGEKLLVPLQSFAYTGSVVTEAGDPVTTEGLAEIVVYDSPIIRQHELGIEYSLAGPTIYRGLVEIVNGQFSGQFMVPLDVDYGGQAARVSGYASLGFASGLGGLDSLSISDQVSSTTDNTGPLIDYSFGEVANFVSGDRIPTNATLHLDISDPSGINLTGGLGHRIEMIIDGDNTNTINMTDRFSYSVGSYQSGTLEFVLPDLKPELHYFKIKAWDNANNPAYAEFEAVPSPRGRIAIFDLVNYPNPMEESTEFFFELSESAEQVDLEIFTLSGKRIKSFRLDNPPVGRNRLFFWDGRDADGDRIAQGVYIYKLTARGKAGISGTSTDNIAEAFGKLVLLN